MDDNQKEIIVAEKERNAPNVDATKIDQLILDASDQSETDEYKGFLDLGFMAQVVVPLSVVYPDSYFEGEIPQGTYNDIESKDKKINPRKRKASFSGRVTDTKTGSSSTTSDGA
ncbi:unnamed protein product [Lactuca saligna]|uniref:Uncharacterized protein n=1 Tax=Lactuca saligna TaxID=75948 RepID=A0AA35YZA2_LACSI|nr:unnamed protein product [Lactuca saligna]